MVSSPDGNGVILFGGYSSQYLINNIIELKADGQGWVGSWTSIATLQNARYSQIVIPVLMNRYTCGISGIVPTTTGMKSP